MKVYSYNWATGAYIGEGEADASPLQPGVWLVPAYATLKKPPEAQPGKQAVYNKETDTWSLEPAPVQASPTPEPEGMLLVDDVMSIGDLFDAQQ